MQTAAPKRNEIAPEDLKSPQGLIAAPKSFRPVSFFIALSIFAILVGLLITAPPQWGSNILRATVIRKHERLQILSSPKVVFIGGSNAAFGIDSQFIQKQLNRDVVNMGMGASLGLRYMLEEVKDDIRSGDILVVTPEYDYFCVTSKAENNARVNGSSILLQVAQVVPKSLKWILPVYFAAGPFDFLEDSQRLIKSRYKIYEGIVKKYNETKFNTSFAKLFEPPASALRANYNEYGDYVTHLDKPAPGFGDNKLLYWEPFKYDKEASRVLSAFGKYAESKGAKVVLIPPPMPEYQLFAPRATEIYLHWLTIPHVTTLAAPQRYTFAVDQFFDTCYHLTRSGRQLRSSKIVEDLQRFISAK